MAELNLPPESCVTKWSFQRDWRTWAFSRQSGSNERPHWKMHHGNRSESLWICLQVCHVRWSGLYQCGCRLQPGKCPSAYLPLRWHITVSVSALVRPFWARAHCFRIFWRPQTKENKIVNIIFHNCWYILLNPTHNTVCLSHRDSSGANPFVVYE